MVKTKNTSPTGQKAAQETGGTAGVPEPVEAPVAEGMLTRLATAVRPATSGTPE